MMRVLYDDGSAATWHVGGRIPVQHRGVDTVQADGHELEAIQKQMPDLITVPNRRIVRWPGVMARFILMNLKNE